MIVDPVKRIIRHELTMDESSSVMEYLQIYMSRIVMCEQAAAFLKCSFDLVINRSNHQQSPLMEGEKHNAMPQLPRLWCRRTRFAAPDAGCR